MDGGGEGGGWRGRGMERGRELSENRGREGRGEEESRKEG